MGLQLRSRLWQVTALAFLFTAGCSTAAVVFIEYHSRTQKRATATDVAQGHLRSLSSSIDLALSATYGLAALVRQGNGTIDNFEKTAGEMVKLYPGVGSLQLAPGGIISQIVPLAGNERAMGHNLLKDPNRTKEAFLARKTGRLTLAGPFPLLQGGTGVVGRMPIFLPDATGQEVFWGFTCVLIQFPEVLDAAGLRELARLGYHYQLYRFHPDHGGKQIIDSYGSGTINSPVAIKVEVPNGEWFLELAPLAGWHNAGVVAAEVAFCLLISLMGALIVNLLLRQPLALRQLVASRTRELSESVGRFSLLLQSAAEGIYGIDNNGCFTFINRSALKSLGYGEEGHVLGKNVHELIHHSYKDGAIYPSCACPIYRAFIQDEPVHSDDEVFWRADQSQFPVEYWSYPMRDGDGKVIGAVVSFVDITERLERNRLEEQLLQAQKMEAVGLLAGGIAHDFNNILTTIVGYGELLKELVKDSEKARNFTAHIISSADRAAKLTRQLLLYSRKQEPVRVLTDLNELVTGFETLLLRVIGENIQLSKKLWPAKTMVEVDVNQIEQVLMNLCINARDAMPRGGVISITTKVMDVDEKMLQWFGLAEAGRFACLTLADSGVGMDRQTQERIFEPFFTTKALGQGTGLGLSTVHGVIRQHGGGIKVYSEPGRGTTFCLFLKFSDAEMVAPSVPEEKLAVPSGNETILVADDEVFIREVLSETLTNAGYTVITAIDGMDAVAKFKEKKGLVRLLLLDVIMPGLNGREAWEKIAEIDGGCRVIFMSGYTADIMGSRGNADLNARLIEKPFASHELLKAVRDTLDGADANTGDGL